MKLHYVSGLSQKQFIGDNVDVMKGVRDIRSNHLKHLCHMYSVLVAKSRLPPVVATAKPRSLRSLCTTSFEPTSAHIASIQQNLMHLYQRLSISNAVGTKTHIS